MVEDQEVAFQVRERFVSINALEHKLDAYKQLTFTQLWKREARTISAVTGKIKRELKKELLYYEIKVSTTNDS